ncbi:hypothetical protein TVAG_458640 [Trichomonas vaginalis G3]|uniref:Tubby C-terminal domain-containing protein n=1 Tax=Trichomonas vaginalis (strain ATCC PRA-98 / G3) TaxID=412133 RepID=A2E669_TRIV3|nr:hypothetical protein TVAGG3_0394070 [Trichomonas vaginalis G3]EAY11792.1 hypothetical protein TVAG_458640 [Trichomonas vaginalis G3]KAI5534200.1 hypothetical protein TVAGG3_0394070 [Trichomonas vaginalis G3]|eukprot:XP_001324015.1 hypothetical protein [Trichomonas vaginalis G3]
MSFNETASNNVTIPKTIPKCMPLPRRNSTITANRKSMPISKFEIGSRMSCSDCENIFDPNYNPKTEEYINQSKLVDCKLPSEPGKTVEYFSCQRTSKFTMRGREYTFTFYVNGQPQFLATCVGRYPSKPIEIKYHDSYSKIDTTLHSLMPSQQNTHFILNIRNSEIPIMVMDVTPECSLSKTPRKTQVGIFDEDGKLKLEMFSRLPILRDGKWSLDFNNRSVIPSDKNTIFQSIDLQRHSHEMIAIRKVNPTTLYADCSTEFSPIAVFGIMLSIFISRMKA